MLRQVKSIETFDESAGKVYVGPGNEFELFGAKLFIQLGK